MSDLFACRILSMFIVPGAAINVVIFARIWGLI